MKIAIVGANPDTWEKVPPLGKEWEVWRFSRRNWNAPPKFSRWFELHHPRNYPRYETACPGYTEFMHTFPHVVHYKNFPWERLQDEFGTFFFHGGQAPWILAYAITLDPQTIGLWGIDPTGKYGPQRYEMQHFAQLALDRGIEVIAPEDKILYSAPLYALEEDYGKGDTMQAIFNPGSPAAAESRKLSSRLTQ